jgi:hypothetical protein
MSGVIARPTVDDEPERVEAVCCRPLELLLVVLFCPEPESVDDDSLERDELAVCVVPLLCASGCEEDELVELLEVELEVELLELLLLDGVVLEEVLVEVSLGVEDDDEVLVLAVCVLAVDDVEDDVEEVSGAVLVDEVELVEELLLAGWLLGVEVVLVDDDVSLGALLVAAAVVVVAEGALEVLGAAPPVSEGATVVVELAAVVVGAVVVGAVVVGAVVAALVVGADAMVIGEEPTELSDVENPKLVGATVEELDVDDLLLVDVLLLCDAVCVAVCTADCAATTAVCTTGLTTGTPIAAALNVPGAVATTCVGTMAPVRFQLVALPVSVSVLLTASCNPVTAAALLSVADEAVMGPPAAMLVALSDTVPLPASITAGSNAPFVANVMALPAAVTAPPKLLAAFDNVIALAPAWRLVVPVTASGPTSVMPPVEVSARLPAVLVASVVDELSTSVTEPVVFTATVPKFAAPCVSEIAPPLVAVSVALPPTLSTSVG